MNACSQCSFSDFILFLGNALLISLDTIKVIPKRHAHRPAWSNNPSLRLFPVTLDYASKIITLWYSLHSILIAINDGPLTPTSGLAANSHLWVCSLGHFSSNWSRLNFPSNPFWTGDFHSPCSLHNAFGKEERRVRQKNLNCTAVATEVPASPRGPSGARRALQDQLRLMQAARTMDTCQELDAAASTGTQVWVLSSIFPCTVGRGFLPLLPGCWLSDFSAVR